jgi:NADH/NAD ratio-sensing transcriptional regulator Rex
MLRLSRYHCFVGELLRSGDPTRLTSHEISEELGVSEESVRRDLSYIDVEGRPGAGYDPALLYEALEDYLGISECFPFVAVGGRPMLEALTEVFPADQFGLKPVAYFSERSQDAGGAVDGLPIRDLDEIASLDHGLGVSVALVACAPESVPRTLELLDYAGVHSVLMLTPVLRPRHPEGMNVTYFRIPCALKALASAVSEPAPCCSVSECAVRKNVPAG